MAKKTVSFLVSGRGSNFTAVMKNINQGIISAKPGIVISDKPDAGALSIAPELGIDSVCINPENFSGREEHEREVYRVLKKYHTDLVVAAGYMRILTPFLVRKFRNRIMNIHPALLPSFPGVHAQKKAFDYGVKITGCTVHFIDEGTDTGPIVMQAAVEILNQDTPSGLAAKILSEEHRILPEAVRLFCEDRIRIAGRKVIINQDQ